MSVTSENTRGTSSANQPALGGALLTKTPTWLTGVATTVLAVVTSFVTEWYQSADASHYDWAKALLGAVAAWAIARAAHRGTWMGSKPEARAYATGVHS